jgi:hypothetical protein
LSLRGFFFKELKLLILLRDLEGLRGPFLRPKDRPDRDFGPIIRATPQARLLPPREIAEVIYFLLSPASRAVTGATVPCDGGVIAGSGWAPYGGFDAFPPASLMR